MHVGSFFRDDQLRWLLIIGACCLLVGLGSLHARPDQVTEGHLAIFGEWETVSEEDLLEAADWLDRYLGQHHDSAGIIADRLWDFVREASDEILVANAIDWVATPLEYAGILEPIQSTLYPLVGKFTSPEANYQVHYHLAYCSTFGEQKDRTLSNHLKALEYAREAGIPNLVFQSLLMLGNGYQDYSRYLEQLQALYQAEEIARNEGLSDNYFRVVNHNLAGVFQSIGNHNKAMEIAREIYSSARADGDVYSMVYASFIIQSSLGALKNWPKLKSSTLKTIHLSDSAGESSAIGYSYSLLSTALVHLGQVDSAMLVVRQGIDISRRQGDIKELKDCRYSLAEAQLASGLLVEAEETVNEALQMEGYLDLQVDLLELMAQIRERQQDFAGAYLYQTMSVNLKDSLENIDPLFILSTEMLEQEFAGRQEVAQVRHEQEIQQTVGVAILIGTLLISAILIAFIRSRSNLIRARNNDLEAINRQLSNHILALEKFAFISSHDLLEPVRVISTTAGLLRRKLRSETAPSIHTSLQHIDDSAKVLLQVTKSIGEYVETLRDDSPAKSVSVDSVREHTLALCADFSGEDGGKSIFWDFDPQIRELYFPEGQLSGVLFRLINNGLVHNVSHQPQARVAAKNQQKEVVFSVTDNGTGIPGEYLDQVFEPFKSLQSKLDSQSSGLGLTICKLIIEKNGGRIWLESTVDQGTTVYFTVPKPNV